jgi:hypothetical protein
MNEPVAWRTIVDGKTYVTDDEFVVKMWLHNGWKEEPLYTHPADESFDRTASHMAGEYVSYPAKTLTDEEINKIYLEKYDGHMGFLSPDEVREFAREILRKTQEK